jgi:hypothetical protein
MLLYNSQVTCEILNATVMVVKENEIMTKCNGSGNGSRKNEMMKWNAMDSPSKA